MAKHVLLQIAVGVFLLIQLRFNQIADGNHADDFMVLHNGQVANMVFSHDAHGVIELVVRNADD